MYTKEIIISVLAVLLTLGFAGVSFSQELDENLNVFPFEKYEVVETAAVDVNANWHKLAAVPSEIDIADTYEYQLNRGAHDASVQVSGNDAADSQDDVRSGDKEAPRLLCADALGINVEEHAADYCRTIMGT